MMHKSRRNWINRTLIMTNSEGIILPSVSVEFQFGSHRNINKTRNCIQSSPRDTTVAVVLWRQGTLAKVRHKIEAECVIIHVTIAPYHWALGQIPNSPISTMKYCIEWAECGQLIKKPSSEIHCSPEGERMWQDIIIIFITITHPDTLHHPSLSLSLSPHRSLEIPPFGESQLNSQILSWNNKHLDYAAEEEEGKRRG